MEKSYRSQPLQILHSPVQCPLLRQWQLNYAPAILLMPNVPRSVPDFLLLQKCHFPFSLLPLLGLAGFPLQSPAARHGLLGLEPKPLSGVLKASNVKEWILSHCPQSRTQTASALSRGSLQCNASEASDFDSYPIEPAVSTQSMGSSTSDLDFHRRGKCRNMFFPLCLHSRTLLKVFYFV